MPLPVPLLPELIVTQLIPLLAVHVHVLLFAVTPTLPGPPAEPNDAVLPPIE